MDKTEYNDLLSDVLDAAYTSGHRCNDEAVGWSVDKFCSEERLNDSIRNQLERDALLACGDYFEQSALGI